MDFAGHSWRHENMKDTTTHDPEEVDLVIQLCTRMGIIMEDVSPLALHASREGLQQRVAEIACEIRAMTAIAGAAESLISQ